MSTERDEIIDDAAANPKSAAVDGTSATGRDLRELIEWDKHQASKEAAASRKAGLKMFKIVGDGAV